MRFSSRAFSLSPGMSSSPCASGARSEGRHMNQRNWIIAAVVVIILIIGYYAMRPGAQAPTETATPPATTEQPAQPAPAQ